MKLFKLIALWIVQYKTVLNPIAFGYKKLLKEKSYTNHFLLFFFFPRTYSPIKNILIWKSILLFILQQGKGQKRDFMPMWCLLQLYNTYNFVHRWLLQPYLSFTLKTYVSLNNYCFSFSTVLCVVFTSSHLLAVE